MKKLLMLIFAFALLFQSQFSAFAASPVKELRQAIASLSYINVETAKLDNVALQAYEYVRVKINLPPIETSATMRFKGYDVSKLEQFADSLEKSPTAVKIEAANSVIAAIGAIKEIHNFSFLLSEEVFATGYQASLSAFSFALKFSRIGQNAPLTPALKAKICQISLNIVTRLINTLSTHLPPDVSRFIPVCLWVGNEICARSLGLSTPSPETGVRSFTVLTIGRISMAFTHGIGFFPRTQRLIDGLGDAAQNSRIAAFNADKKAKIDGELNRIKAQAAKIRRISSNERQAAGLSRNLSELLALVSVLDPTKISAGASAAAGTISAGAYVHSFYAPLKKHCDLSRDIENLLKVFYGEPAAPNDASESFEVDESIKLALAEKEKKIKALLAQYKEACAELEELSNTSSGQKEFFLKLKEVERLDYEIGKLSVSK